MLIRGVQPNPGSLDRQLHFRFIRAKESFRVQLQRLQTKRTVAFGVRGVSVLMYISFLPYNMDAIN